MKKYVGALLAAIPSIGGVLYFTGILYNWSYFNFWGIDRYLFPATIQENISSGVIAVTLVLMEMIWRFIALTLILFLLSVCVTYLLRSVESSITSSEGLERFRRKVDSLISKHSSQTKEQLQKDNLLAIISIAFSLILFVAVMVLAVYYVVFMDIGRKVAQDQYDKLRTSDDSGKFSKQVEIEFRDGVSMDSAVVRNVIVCSDLRCAFLTDVGVEIIERDLIARMVFPEIKVKNEKK